MLLLLQKGRSRSWRRRSSIWVPSIWWKKVVRDFLLVKKKKIQCQKSLWKNSCKRRRRRRRRSKEIVDKKNCKRDIFVVKKIPRRQLWKLCKRRNKKKILRRRLWKLCKRRKTKKKLQRRKEIQRDCCENFARVEDWRNKTKGGTVKSLQEKKKKKIQGDCKKVLQGIFLVIKNTKTKPRTLQVEERRREKISKDASSINQSMTSEGTTTQNSHFDSSFCTTHLTSATRI